MRGWMRGAQIRMYARGCTLTRHEPFISNPGNPGPSVDRGRGDDKASNPHADFRAGSSSPWDACTSAEYIRLNDRGLLNANWLSSFSDSPVSRGLRDIPSIFTAFDGSLGSNRSYVEFHDARVKEKCNFIIAKRTKGGVFGFRVSLEVIAPSSDFQEGEM